MQAATIFETHPLNIVMSSGIERKGGGALCVQMDFMWTFEASAKSNNINHVLSHFCKILVVLKYHRCP